MNKQKILLIADSDMSLSGVPVVFMSIAKALHKDITFDIIVLKDNDMYFEKEFLSLGGKVYRFNCPKPENPLKKIGWLLGKYPQAVRKFLGENINLKEYIAIHSFHEQFSYPFFKEAKKAGLKSIILHICSAGSAYPSKKTFNQRIVNWYQKKAKRCCSNLVFVSQRSMQYNNYKRKGVVLYNSYDKDKFGKIIESSHKNLVLTQIGTFSSRKNQLFSLEVIKAIKNRGQKVLLNIVGQELDPGYLEKMHAYIRENNLSDCVKFLEPKTDRIELNKSTSFIIYPSTLESFGLVLIESQASGIHCFANEALPHDADMGNIDFLELNAALWASRIIGYFAQHGNVRKKPLNCERFSNTQFIDVLRELYKY